MEVESPPPGAGARRAESLGRALKSPTLAARSATALLCALGVALAIVTLAGCQPDLPERDSYAGRLYAERCGQCHAPFSPQALTPAMWGAQVELMEGKMRQAGLPVLDPGQRRTILNYLKRNSKPQ